jgi:hypothetical protein
MKKMFGIVVVLLIVYIAFQVIYSYSVGSKTNKYNMVVAGKKYQITETFNSRHRSANSETVDKSSYYYNITNNDKLSFAFKIVGNYSGIKEFLIDLKIYENESLICAFPTFKGEVDNIDVICNINDKLYLYNTIKGKYVDLDNFVSSLKALGYDHPAWDELNLETKTVNNFAVYSKNITNNQTITIWQDRGFYRITDRGENLFSLGSGAIFDPNLSAMVNQYYVVPEYKIANKFSQFFITNLITGDMESFDLGQVIAYDSFIQGVVNNKIYLIDRANKVQYEIDIYNKKVVVTGNVNNDTRYYFNGKWQPKPIAETINNNLVFQNEQTIPDNLKKYNPLYVDSIGGDTDGYYYLYLLENNIVNVYRVDKLDTDILTLIFSVPSISNIKYKSDDIYFTTNDTLYMYRENLGLRPLIKYREFATNKSNLYNVYVGD